jgi:hypothetical protein
MLLAFPGNEPLDVSFVSAHACSYHEVKGTAQPARSRGLAALSQILPWAFAPPAVWVPIAVHKMPPHLTGIQTLVMDSAASLCDLPTSRVIRH